MSEPLLQVRELTVDIRVGHRVVHAVRSIGYDVAAGQTVAVVGESGSGKTVSAMALLGLLPPTATVGGQVLLDGTDVAALGTRDLRRLRGSRIGMIFQDPMTALNPVRTIGSQLVEVIRQHQQVSFPAARRIAVAALDRARIPNAARRSSAYVHELSGGMRQRVMIALATVNRPAVLVADEPTTALDVTVAAQIIDMLRELQERDGTAILLITHDLSLVADFADRVLVMYGGRIVESAPAGRLFSAPEMPYTLGLLACSPAAHTVVGRLRTIPGAPPDLAALGPGCPFAPRCPLAVERCREAEPALVPSGRGVELHLAACHRRDTVRTLPDADSIFPLHAGVEGRVQESGSILRM